jgi:hypothetical protein
MDIRLYLEKHGMLKRERRYQCSVCNYMAYTRSILARHEAKHATNRRPEFRCDVCGARLMTVHSLKEHKQLSHTDARPFPCALCGFAAKCTSIVSLLFLRGYVFVAAMCH